MKPSSNALLESLVWGPRGTLFLEGAQGAVGRGMRGIPTAEFPTGFRESFRVSLKSTCSKPIIPVEPDMLLKQ